jgi:glyoxylase-like metal-dependent hydrolase (beta-lactamase superfamily II)
MLEGEVQFHSLLSRDGLRVDVRRFRPAGVFVTPETSPRRFHARYYLIDQVAIGDEELIPGELVSLEWMTPGEARRRWRQKELELAPPVAFVLETLATSSLDAAIGRLAAAEPFTTGPASCHEVRPGIRVMPLRAPALPPAMHTNCLIVGDSQLFLIDPAATDEDEQQRLTTQLDHWMQKGAKLAAVLLTHAHIDHVGSAALLRDRYGVPLCAHEATVGRVEFPIDRTLSDDETISIPGDPQWQLRCLHTPGHDPGHLCFLEETSATLISGDMVAGQSSIVIPHGHGGDMSAYLDSMHRLLKVDCDLLIPSHGFAVANPSNVIQAQIDQRLARVRKNKAALDGGVKGINELLEVCYDDAPTELRKFAEHTLKAHLVRLGVTEFDD